MAYSNFTLAKLKKNYGLEQYHCYLFAEVAILAIEPSLRLQEDLLEAKEVPVMTEKAKSEAIIYPIIKEVKRKNPQISIFSGYALTVESDKELNGNPDFMISAKPNKVSPEAPLFCMVEAKNGVIEEGYAQCAAEMYAARLFNQENNEPYETIYGAVTNAYDWVFLKLEGNTIFIDKERYFLNELPKLLGILQFIINQYKS
ncbi:MAG: hypothetical protein ACOVQA_12625 [Thermoflexibacteraceae bacterium]|jgi:hypothetical protein